MFLISLSSLGQTEELNELKNENKGELLLRLWLVDLMEIFFHFKLIKNFPDSEIQTRKFAPIPFSHAPMLFHTNEVLELSSNI